VSDRASPEIAEAIAQYEAESPNGLEKVLALAQPADALMIANLARVVPVAQKRTVLETLQKLVCAPQETTIDEALADLELFDMWFDEVYLVHIGASKPKCSNKP
jgi:hypothetical protein